MKTHRGDFSVNRRLLLLNSLALTIGVLSACVAKLLLLMIALFTNVFYYGSISIQPNQPSSAHWGIWFFLVPVVGSLMIGLMARFGSEKIRGHGIPEALEAILFGKSIVDPKVAILKPLSSAISIGSGGPFGAEGPIIMTGGAVGSLVAQCFSLTAAERKTLLTAGAAAGMSAIFATPIAAVLLSVELLLFEWRPRSLIPVATASIVAAVVRLHLIGAGPIFPVSAHVVPGEMMLFDALIAGLVAGLASALLSKSLYRLEDLFQKLPIHWMWWPVIGGLAVGLGGLVDPRALGVGYEEIAAFLSGTTHDVGRLFFVKAVIWLIALASGTSGGVLAPLLIFGCALGQIESHWFTDQLSSATWSLIGMSAIMAGMMRAPFTAILFSLELTRDVDSLMPIFVASFGSYMVTVLIMKRSILTEKIARRGYDIFREYGVDPLERLRVVEVMSRDPKTVAGSDPARTLLDEKFAETKKSGLPVLNGAALLGIVVTSDIERIPGLDTLENLKISDMVQRPPVTTIPDATCREAADLMAEHDIGRLLVVDSAERQKLLGIVTRTDLLKARHRHMSEESVRERIREPVIAKRKR